MGTDINPHARITKLIDEASARAGSDNRLATLLEVTRGNVSEWRHGKRACPLEAQVLMADIAGLNPHEVLAYAVIERHANTPRGEKLYSALGKVSGFTSAARAALLAICASVALAFSPSPAIAATSYDV